MLDPFGLGGESVGLVVEVLAGGIDPLAAELLEGVAHGVVVDRGVTGGHARAGVAEKLLDDVLRDAGVDQSCPNGVPELMRLDAHCLAGLVVHTDAALPAAELTRKAAVGVGQVTVGILLDPREQPRRPIRTALAYVGLLGPDGLGGLGAEGDELLGADLGVGETQAGPADAVVDEGVEGELAGVAAPQPGLYEQDDEVADTWAGEQVQVGVGLELSHDELGHEPGQGVLGPGHLFDVEHGTVGQAGQLAVTVTPLEEPAQHGEREGAGSRLPRARRHPRQIVLQHRTGHAGDVDDVGVSLVEELGEPGHALGHRADGAERRARREAEPAPVLDRVAQPRLSDRGEPGGVTPSPGRDAEVDCAPDITGISGVDVITASWDNTQSKWPCGFVHSLSPVSPHTPARWRAARVSATSRCT